MMQLHLKEILQHDKLAGGIAASAGSATIRVKAPPNGGRWSDHEHKLFLQGIELYGKDWRRIARLVQTRTTVQTRSHAQKHFDRLEKERREDNLLMAERAAKAGFLTQKTDSPVMAPKRRSHAAGKKSAPLPSAKKPPSVELSNVTFPSVPQPPLAMIKTNFAQPPARFLDDHMYRYLHGNVSAKPPMSHRLAPPNLEEFGLPMHAETNVLDYISFDEGDDDHFVDDSARPDMEYLLDAMPGTDFYAILDEAKGGLSPQDNADELKQVEPPRSLTPHDHPVIAYEPSISPIRQQRGVSFPRPIRLESPSTSPDPPSVMNSIYV